MVFFIVVSTGDLAKVLALFWVQLLILPLFIILFSIAKVPKLEFFSFESFASFIATFFSFFFELFEDFYITKL